MYPLIVDSSPIDRLKGPIFRLSLGGNEVNIVSTNALVNECCDETRFAKKPAGVLGVSLLDMCLVSRMLTARSKSETVSMMACSL